MRELEPVDVFGTEVEGESFIYLERASWEENLFRKRIIQLISGVLVFSSLLRILMVSFSILELSLLNIVIIWISLLTFSGAFIAVRPIYNLRQNNSGFGITSAGLHFRYGLLNQKQGFTSMSEIESVLLKQDIMAKKKGYGNIHLKLKEGGSRRLWAVSRAKKFKDTLESLLEDSE